MTQFKWPECSLISVQVNEILKLQTFCSNDILKLRSTLWQPNNGSMKLFWIAFNLLAKEVQQRLSMGQAKLATCIFTNLWSHKKIKKQNKRVKMLFFAKRSPALIYSCPRPIWINDEIKNVVLYYEFYSSFYNFASAPKLYSKSVINPKAIFVKIILIHVLQLIL